MSLTVIGNIIFNSHVIVNVKIRANENYFVFKDFPILKLI